MVFDEYHYTLYKKTGKDRKSDIYYYCYKDDDGIWKKRSTGQTTERKARAFVNKLIADKRFKGQTSKKDITFQEFAESNNFWVFEKCPYVQNAIARKGKYSRELCKSNGDCMRKHIFPIFGSVKLRSITKAMINNWLICLPDAKKISNKSANNVLYILYYMLEIASDMQLINKEIVLDRVKALPKNSKVRPAFTVEQINSMFDSVWNNKYAYIGCKLASVTGMRLGEIRALTSEQVYEDHILVNASWSDAEGRKSPKNGRTREIPITNEINEMLKSITHSNGLIFTIDGKTPVGDKFFTNPLRKRMNEVGIDYSSTDNETSLSFHSFRHYFNSRLVAAGISAEVIRAVIGHVDEAMTKNYTHLELSDIKTVTEIQVQILSKVA